MVPDPEVIRISKVNRITSIADLIASRYGKSANRWLGDHHRGDRQRSVHRVAAQGDVDELSVLLEHPDIGIRRSRGTTPVLRDTAL